MDLYLPFPNLWKLHLQVTAISNYGFRNNQHNNNTRLEQDIPL